MKNKNISLPHTRGGVSLWSLEGVDFHKSSPHPWGCFRLLASFLFVAIVFPTPVGVFPEYICSVLP